MTGFRDLRQNHDFTVLWVGQTVSELGTRVSMFVFPLVTYAITGSAMLAAIAGALDLLGMALALLPGGLLADRLHRGRVMRFAAGSGVLLYGSLVVAGVLGVLTVPHLFVVALLTGAAAGVFAPAEMSAVRAVVPTEQLPTALSQQQARQHVAGLVGGPLGGVLYAVTRWAPFLFDALTFAVSWVLLGRIRTDLSPAPRAGARRRAREDVAEGLRFAWTRPFFRTLMVWGMLSNLVVNALFVAATLRLIEAGYAPWSIGLVETAAGVCGVLGAMAAPRLIARFATGRLTVLVAWSFVPAAGADGLLEPPRRRRRGAVDRGVPQPGRQRRHRLLQDGDHPAASWSVASSRPGSSCPGRRCRWRRCSAARCSPWSADRPRWRSSPGSAPWSR